MNPFNHTYAVDRRSFLSWVGLGWLASSLPVVIASYFAETPANAAAPKLNLTCTHQGCAVKWQAAQNSYVCPCHGSKFDRNGKLFRGLAKNPLKTL